MTCCFHHRSGDCSGGWSIEPQKNENCIYYDILVGSKHDASLS